MKKLLVVAGARPNFMKIAPLIRALATQSFFSYKIVHTGQHYDSLMSETFFEELGIPVPDYNLNVGSASHSVQTAAIMVEFEKICLIEIPDVVIVMGDVNSTLSCGIVTKKLNIKLAHVEAGLRSFDRAMPEEINRIVTDSISDYFFVTEKSGLINLEREGQVKNVHFVGQIMIDNLYYQLECLKKYNTLKSNELLEKLEGPYAVLTLHRPSNVEDKRVLTDLITCFKELSRTIPIIFPCHPRTMKKLKEFNIPTALWVPGAELTDKFIVTNPFGYMDFLNIWKNSRCVLTDSGGLQEETTALKIPCITIRENTERPITVEIGSNEISGMNVIKIGELFNKAVTGTWKKSEVPELWDGKTSDRIVSCLKEHEF
jgi:UDP-N-acetylglucosamine 2-epimerase (non-hydrolysing)